ncbi:hypothetical protein K1T35_32870 [Pseudonocardia sp. DSM 110487]|uniref:hypothetical protein n=1 Tax=Pseudonocardia sp. DSM 110487 TaxID=2865833 RepID=UPI001C6A62E7|nr:hypothetical protein [Pseudonocardia sp. DSM 110487]QYN33282.1 hypothetical protein K1T35_32870 [Pseudonocardia sp. DSM 110487]
MPLIQTCTVDDPLHGVVIVHTDIEHGWVEVAGDGFPAVHLRRSETAEVSAYVPIGTRDPAQLTLTVDGTPATLTLGRGRFTRGSFRVDAHVDGVHYHFSPSDEDGSRLSRDGQRLGELMLEPETVELMAVWTPAADVRPRDAAVGYALATAFGTGAESTLTMLINTVVGPFGG